MALIVHFAPKGMDHEKYAEVLRRLEAAGNGAPRGRLHHAAMHRRSLHRETPSQLSADTTRAPSGSRSPARDYSGNAVANSGVGKYRCCS